MPSVHLGIATLVALALWPTPVRWLAVLYVPAMLWAVVYGGEHYVCDGLAGIAIASVCWALAAKTVSAPTAQNR